jgi:hypothetical protein
MESTELQSWSCTASGCFANVMPVLFSYACKADSKSAREVLDVDWSRIPQVGRKFGIEKGSWFAARK